MTTEAAPPMSASRRKQILRVLLISLLLDLISFTFILPLFPSLLDFYRHLERDRHDADTPLTRILQGLNTYKNAFARPISDRYDIVLLGGALGSLFSLLQALAAPIIGRLSDRYGRRAALLCCMVGNLLSVALWLAATDFRTFLASRIVGGLSEGNVQIATEIAADISDERSRGSTMAMIASPFTVGPALGAALASVSTVAANPFGTAAAVSFALIAIETAYLYVYLPETHVPSSSANKITSNGTRLEKTSTPKTRRTNTHFLLNLTHFAFLLFFSGLEFSLPFITYDVFAYSSSQTGRLLGVIGLIASVLQGSVVRRMDPLVAVRAGVATCALAFWALDQLTAASNLWTGVVLLAFTSATVVTGLKSLSSFEANQDERGGKLGNHRSWGQVGRALGPIIFCSLYWWAGRQLAFRIGCAGMIGVLTLTVFGLQSPPRSALSRNNGRKKVGMSKNVPNTNRARPARAG
ncbi:MAG: hypothetical protein M1823_005968 [Watsoniomyces obsoletus]|nr:MAG: hypothetical protein M1823_005968 [Watsoniomyces obsoletus]